MNDPKKAAADFLTVCPDNRRESCERALDLLVGAAEGAPLFNVDFKAAKETLSYTIERAYEARVSEPFLHARGWNPEAALDSHLGLNDGLHSMMAKAKKLGKLKPESKLEDWKFQDVNPAMVEAVREVLDAACPVAELVKELKGQVVKGRKPAKPSAAKKEALAKEAAKRTCPCCFRPMALNSDGKVVRHGWQEQGGRQAGSYGNAWHVGQCFGVGYEPYEMSCQGTKDFHEHLLKTKAQMERELATLEARPAKLRGSYRKGRGFNAEHVSFELEDDGASLEDVKGWRDGPSKDCPTGSYAWNLRKRTEEAKRDLRMLQSDLNTLAKAVEDWKATA